jgi:L-lactate permease
MDANKELAESAKRQIKIAEQKHVETELAKTIKLSQKVIWIAVILSLLIPITGYIYTRRWKTMLIVFSCIIGAGVVIGASSENKE